MPTIVPSEEIEGVVLVVPDVHGDERGRFVESYRREWLPLGREMIQSNRSERQAGAVVGLHYHLHQADYWYVLRGTARVVLHDLREGSSTDGATSTLDLTGRRGPWSVHPARCRARVRVAHRRTALVPGGRLLQPADELGLAWDDPVVGADWGVVDPVLVGA